MASAESVDKLAQLGSIVDKAGGRLMEEGERPPRVAVVLRGTVVATWSGPDGRIVDAGLFGPGMFIGMPTLIAGLLPSGIVGLTSVTMLIWPSREFRAISDADLALSLDLLDRSIHAIQLVTNLLKARMFTTAASRLAGLLLRYEALAFSGTSPLVGRGQLSALTGVSPQMVSRILRKWEAAGIVRRIGASGLELLDRAALETEAAPLADFPPPESFGRLAAVPDL
jgi:CRP-like cAMP-binding protein